MSPTRGASSLNKNPRSPVKEKLELLCPTSSTVLKETKLSKKIKNEIDEFYKMIKKEDIPKGGYRNRPAVNLNKPELDFNSVSYLLTSPSNYRSFLTLKGEMSSNRGSYNKSNRSFISRQDDSFERFEKELGKSKNALLRSGSKKY